MKVGMTQDQPIGCSSPMYAHALKGLEDITNSMGSMTYLEAHEYFSVKKARLKYY